MKRLKSYALYFAWLISLLGMLASLFFGEWMRYEPCRLCWYQRICLFPLAVILGIATYKEDKKILSYALPLCVLGALFAIYQVLEEYLPALQTPILCGIVNDCTNHVFKFLGFVTFPLISLVGFLLIFFALWTAKSSE
jgi:disulfide bond formation protein DsbB